MKMMRRISPIVVLLPFLLAGCFQQAGEAIQPVDITQAPPVDSQPSTIESVVIPPPEGGSDVTPLPPDDSGTSNGDPSLTEFPATATLELAITIISPTIVLPTEEGASAGVGEVQSGEAATPETQTFRTPSSPLGPVTQEAIEPVAGAVATATPSGLITPTAFGDGGIAGTSGGECTYTIQRGDTLFRIATANNTTVAAMLEANPEIGNGNLIQPGDILNLPSCGEGGAPPAAPTTAPDTSVNPPVAGEGNVHTVERGETLFAIAQRYGVTVQAIVDANNLANPNQLDVGQQLIIPPGS